MCERRCRRCYALVDARRVRELLFLEGLIRETMKVANESIWIVGCFALHYPVCLSGDGRSNEDLCIALAVAQTSQSFVRLARLGRIIVTQLVVHDFEIDCLQPTIVAFLFHDLPIDH